MCGRSGNIFEQILLSFGYLLLSTLIFTLVLFFCRESVDHLKSLFLKHGSDCWWKLSGDDLLPKSIRQGVSNYHPRTKDDGRLCFYRCLSLNTGAGGNSMISGPRPLPWSLVPSPFWQGYPMVSDSCPFPGPRSFLGGGGDLS